MPRLQILNSFNYLVVALASRFVDPFFNIPPGQQEPTLPTKLDLFNLNNDFGFGKISLFPFLLTIANGQKQDLMTHFTDENEHFYFKTSTYGIINRGLNDAITKLDPNLVFGCNRYSATIDTAKTNFVSLESYREHLIESAPAEQRESFRTILLKIDYSIKFLHESRIPNFANKNFSSLSFWSKNNLAYKLYFTGNDTPQWNSQQIVNFSRIVHTETYDLGTAVS